jgi:hypothetical protein
MVPHCASQVDRLFTLSVIWEKQESPLGEFAVTVAP